MTVCIRMRDRATLQSRLLAVITEGETDLAQARHVREAESRGFHDEDVGRPAFGYEQFDGDAVRIEGGGGVDRVLDEASSIP